MAPVGVRFGDCELSVERIELRRGGEIIDVEPQVFDVLAYLLRHRERVVPKTELLDQIWGNRFVSESALSSRIKSARRAVGDTGRDQRVIKTIYGRGYRFVADANEQPSAADRAAAGVTAPAQPSQPSRPSSGYRSGNSWNEPGEIVKTADRGAHRKRTSVTLASPAPRSIPHECRFHAAGTT
jgi:DNA-binding winged helix-turn-helix (wHTH) protein